MSKRKQVKLVLSVACAAALAGNGAARAASYQWIGPGGTTTAPASGMWNNAANWSGGLPVSDLNTSLLFGGNGSTPYSAQNDIGTTPFTLNYLSLNNPVAGGVTTISGNPLRFVWGGGQKTEPRIGGGSGAFVVNNDIVLADRLTVGPSGPVTLAGSISGTAGLRVNRLSTLALTAHNTYAGTTEVSGGPLYLKGAGTTGLGLASVLGGALLIADSSANIPADNLLLIGLRGFAQFNTLDNAAINRIAPASSGVLGIGANTSVAIDLTGRAGISLGINLAGADGAPAPTLNLSGTIIPANDTWRFGGNIAVGSSLSSSVLASACLNVTAPLADGPAQRSVRIVTSGISPGRMKLSNTANSYGGGTVVESGAALYFDYTPQPGQTPLGTGPLTISGNLILGGAAGGIGALPNDLLFQTGGTLYFDNKTAGTLASVDRWPDARALAMNGCTLNQRGHATSSLTETTGSASISGHNRAILTRGAAGVTNALEFSSLSRVGRGTIEFQTADSGAFGAENQFKLTSSAGLPLGPGNALPPWAVGNLSGSGDNQVADFLYVDGSRVLRPVSYDGGRDGFISMTYTSGLYNGEFWGAKLFGFSVGTAGRLTLRGGGLILNSANYNSNDGIWFEKDGAPIEGVIYVQGNAILGSILAADGLTKFGTGRLFLSGANIFNGTLTINQGAITLDTPDAVRPENELFVDQSGTFDLFGHDVTVAGLRGTGQVLTQVGAAPGATLTVASASDCTFAGTLVNAQGSLALTKSGPGALTLSGNNTYTGPTAVTAGRLSLTQSFRTSSSLAISDGARATITARSAGVKVLQVGALSLAPTAVLDLNDNDLVVTAGSFDAIRDLVFQGYSSTVDGSTTGIISTTGQSAGNTILALFDNALVGVPDWPFGSGATISPTAIVGKYAFFGDSNLDGQVSADDYAMLDSNLGTAVSPGIAWLSGDANLDGQVSADDYAILDSNLGGAGGPLSPVPEPAGLALLVAAGAIGCRRRRLS